MIVDGEPVVSPEPERAVESGAVPSALARLGTHASGSYGLLSVSADGGHLVASPKPDRVTADGYLELTAHILIESQKRGFRSIGVFSSLDGEGRTAAAVNLAVCLGRARGRQGRVLLVDGDARNRALSKLFCGGAEGGGEDGPATRHPMLIGTALDGVDLMTAPTTEDGLSVTTPEAWSKTFDDLGGLYPHIVVDCPAVLENPEGIVLRECVDQLVLVVRAGRPRRQVERALGSLGDRVIGVILNGGPGGAARSESQRS